DYYCQSFDSSIWVF
nr:immunoglobulin light chain junction region [Macaca mulatta]MOW02048.1 immunoglobulin light chain junction region [Macaca mulatta]MOW02245.1 immunoglobulin light chain junction region [Macaca mulatta]MOW02289.1 immunoglobulin light chain junction region [Macaca mulatta]MOW02320.1 immunoglobulin light chain junction region [Macaca mulatta]